MRPLGWRKCGRTCRPILRIRKAGTSWPADAYPAVPAPTCVRTATASTSRITRWRQAGRGYVPGTTVSTLLTLWRPQVTIREPASEPFPQSLQSQVLVLPREVRQPALLRLWALHYPLPGADRPPGGRT